MSAPNFQQYYTNNRISNEDIYNSDDDGNSAGIKKLQISQSDQHLTQFKEFLDAIKSQNFELVQKYIEKYQSKYDFLNRIDNESHQTPLFYASIYFKDHHQCYQVLKYFVERGAKPDTKDHLKQTPLYYLAKDGKSKCVEYLCQKGCPVQQPDFYGQSALYYASRDGQLEVVKILLNYGADINMLDGLRQTALFYAAREGRIDICKYLIEKGININQMDQHKQTALYWAKKYNKQEVIKLLIDCGIQDTVNRNKSSKDKIKDINAAPSSVTSGQSKQNLDTQQQQSLLKKRKKEKDPKMTYRLYFTDELGNVQEINTNEFLKFKEQYPQVADLMLNPHKVNVDSHEKINDVGERETWQKGAKKILSNLWKMKGGHIFHEPVNPIKLNIPDYPSIIKKPMDLGTIKNQIGQLGQVFQKELEQQLISHNLLIYCKPIKAEDKQDSKIKIEESFPTYLTEASNMQQSENNIIFRASEPNIKKEEYNFNFNQPNFYQFQQQQQSQSIYTGQSQQQLPYTNYDFKQDSIQNNYLSQSTPKFTQSSNIVQGKFNR